MAYIKNSKKFGYDNIATGSAAGQENHVRNVLDVAGAGGVETTKLTLDSRGNTSTSVLAVGRPESYVGGASSNNNTNNDPSSATSPEWTSTTSFVSAQAENVG